MGWQHWRWHYLRRLIGTIGSIFCTQFVIRAISSTKDVRSAKRSTWIAFFFCLPIALAIAIIGVAAKYLHPEINSLYALPVFLQDMNPRLAGLVTTSLVASIFVSVSTVALAIASLVVKDFYVPWRNPTPDRVQSHALGIVNYRLPAADLCAAGARSAETLLFHPRHPPVHYRSGGHRLLCPFFRSTRGANAGLIGACVVTSVWYLLGDPFGINNMYVAWRPRRSLWSSIA